MPKTTSRSSEASVNVVPDLSNVVGFPLSEKKAKIIRDPYGNFRVVVRRYYWDSVDQRGKEKREYLGYVVDNVYYATEDYRRLFHRDGTKRCAPKKSLSAKAKDKNMTADLTDSSTQAFLSSLSTILVAEFPVYYAIAKETGLLEDLAQTWGADNANKILAIAFHWMHTSSNSAYLFKSWVSGKLLPYWESMESKEMTEFFRELVEQPDWRKTFFNARIARLPEDEVLSYDSTRVATEAVANPYAQCGKGKEGGYQKQVGLALLLGHKTGMPVFFRMFPGQIADVSTVADMLLRFDEINEKKKIFAAVMDRGYFSLSNFAKFVDSRSKVIVAATMDVKWIREAIEKAITSLWEGSSHIRGDIFGVTVPVKPKFDDNEERELWVHVFRSDSKSSIETQAFFTDLEDFESQWKNWDDDAHTGVCPLLKSRKLAYYRTPTGLPRQCTLERDNEKINEAIRYFGFFCDVSTMPAKAAEVYDNYCARDLIEKAFRSGKSDVEMNVARAHSDITLEGRFLISFVALTILTDFHRRMKQKTTRIVKGKAVVERPIGDEMTLKEIRNYLGSIRLINDGRGNRIWQEVTVKQHNIARRLGFPDLYRELPDWGPR